MKKLIVLILTITACNFSAMADDFNAISNMPKKPANYNQKHPDVIKSQKLINANKVKLDKENKGVVLLNDWMEQHGYKIGEK